LENYDKYLKDVLILLRSFNWL